MARDAGRTGRRPPGGSARPGRAAYAGAGQQGSGQPAATQAARPAPAGKAASADSVAALRAAVWERLAPALAEAGFDLEDLNLSRAGSRSVLRVAVDRDGGVDLDAVAEASRLISDLLDQVGDEAGLIGAYMLEVTSPGVDRPLTLPRHWRRARGRLVEARRADGTAVVGRVLGADDDGADLAVAVGPVRRGRPVRTQIERLRFADVAHAVVQIEFGHADSVPDAASAAGGSGAAEGQAAAGEEPDEDEFDEDEAPGEEDHLGAGDDVWDEDDDEDLDDEGLDEDDGNDDGGGAEGPRGLERDAPAGGGPATGNDLGGARRGRAGGGHEDSGPSPGEETDR